MRNRLMGWLVLGLIVVPLGWAQTTTQTPATKKTADGNAPTGAAETPDPAAPLSEAERITRLKASIADDEARLKDLTEKLADPNSEYAKAEREFEQLDTQLKDKQTNLAKLQDSGGTPSKELQDEIDDLTKRRKLAKDRFDLAIQERKATQEQLSQLNQKLAQEREALAKLIELPATQPTTTAPATGAPAGAPPSAQPAATPAAPSATPTAPPAEGAPAAAPNAPTAEPNKPVSKEVQQAQQDLQEKQAAAVEAQQAVESLDERIALLEREIKTEQEQVQLARKNADNALETERALTEQIDKLQTEGGSQQEIRDLRQKVGDARKRFREARTKSNERVDRLDSLQDQLQQLQAERIAALQEAESRQAEADKAEKAVKNLENPFAWRNLMQWGLDHGTRIVAILIIMFILLWVMNLFDKRLVKVIAARQGGTRIEREARAQTLTSVFHSAANVVIIGGALIMVVQEFGIAVVPLLGAAGVVGLAFAFGAQNLVRDYFTGFMILLENQYTINDVVKLGSIAGLVERITLRVTVLRDLEGTVHFVPNGQITTVSNMTHGWSRALFDIGISYNSDIDLAIETLMQIGRDARKDPKLGPLILDDPEMLGVDSLGDSAVVIKFFIKTRPIQQWTVKRALLKTIKQRFDEIGVEIPFPHRTVYHRFEQPPEIHMIGEAAAHNGAER